MDGRSGIRGGTDKTSVRIGPSLFFFLGVFEPISNYVERAAVIIISYNQKYRNL
jgi:hypothetical protein